MDGLPMEEDGEPQAKSKRGAVMIFVLGWICIPFFAILLSELESPWLQVVSVALLAYIAVFIGAAVRVVKNF